MTYCCQFRTSAGRARVESSFLRWPRVQLARKWISHGLRSSLVEAIHRVLERHGWADLGRA